MVAVVLLGGLYTLWVGGEVSRNWSNRLMRIRVLAQLVAVLIILAVLYFSGREHAGENFARIGEIEVHLTVSGSKRRIPVFRQAGCL